MLTERELELLSEEGISVILDPEGEIIEVDLDGQGNIIKLDRN